MSDFQLLIQSNDVLANVKKLNKSHSFLKVLVLNK